MKREELDDYLKDMEMSVEKMRRDVENKYSLKHSNPFEAIVDGMAFIMESILYIFGLAPKPQSPVTKKINQTSVRNRIQRSHHLRHLYSLPRRKNTSRRSRR